MVVVVVVDGLKSLADETVIDEARVIGGAKPRAASFSIIIGLDGLISFGLSLRLFGKVSLPRALAVDMVVVDVDVDVFVVISST